MIQGIQNVSFNGGKGQAITVAANKVEAKFVNAAMNLTNTKNARDAAESLANVKLFEDKSNMGERVMSYVNSRQPIAVEKSAGSVKEIIPENSINYIC